MTGMGGKPRCTRCNIVLEPDQERCPQCLRKSTIADPAEGITNHADDPPKHLGVRAGLGGVGLLLGIACAAALIYYESWLTDHGLWLSALALSAGMTTLPIEVALIHADEHMTTREALRHYGLMMLMVAGLALLFATVLGLVWRVFGDSVLSIFGGLLLFLLLIFTVPVVIASVTRHKPLSARALVKGAGLAVAITAAVAALAWLRAERSKAREPKTLYVPRDAKMLLDPLDLSSVRIKSRTAAESDGTTTLHMEADADDFQRTLTKLSVEVMTAVDRLTKDSSASGRVMCWVPEHLRSIESARKLAEQEALINGALVSSDKRTASGHPIRVSFAFGAIGP